MKAKTAYETKEYLESQPWYSSFKKHVIDGYMKGEYPQDYCRELLNGEKLDDTLSLIDWDNTEEGYRFWWQAHDDLQKWFNNR